MSTPEGQVFDLGYRHYDGPREGRGRARQALFVNGIRTCFGLGRGALAKVLPILFFVAVMAPAALLSVAAGLLGEGFADFMDLPGPGDYYEIVSPILFIFAAIIAPELLCPDRRDGVINLYLVRPLTFTDYVLGRWSAFFLVSVVFIYSGQVLLLIGLVLGASEPFEYLSENWMDIPRFLGAGLAIALITTTIPLAAASLTTRRAYASVAVIGLFIISTVTAESLMGVECTTVTPDVSDRTGQSSSGASVEITIGERREAVSDTECEWLLGDSAPWARMIDIANVQMQVSDMIFGSYDDPADPRDLERLPAAVMAVWYLVVAGLPAYLLWSRYRRLTT